MDEKENSIKIEPGKITKEDVSEASQAVQEAREQGDILVANNENNKSEKQILQEIDDAICKKAAEKGIGEEYLKDERDC